MIKMKKNILLSLIILAVITLVAQSGYFTTRDFLLFIGNILIFCAALIPVAYARYTDLREENKNEK